VRALPLLFAIVLLATPASARAQLPDATRSGIDVARGPGGRIAIRFHDTRAGRAAYRPFAGRTVTVRCQSVGDHPVGSGPVGVATAKISFRPTLSTLRLRVRGTVNLCTLGSIRIATDAASRRFLADLEQAEVLPAIASLARAHGAAATARRLHPRGGVLPAPTATPPRGRVGVYARDGVVAAVAVSGSGRRMFLDGSADVARTNVLGVLRELNPAAVPQGARLPAGDTGTPLPETTDPEITARREGSAAVIDITGSARDDLGTSRVTVSCTSPKRDLLGTDAQAMKATRAAPPVGRPLRVAVPARYHLCSVSFGRRIARVAVDDAGRGQLEESTIAAGFDRVLHTAGAAAAAGSGYPTGQALSDAFGGAVAPLAAPTDTPPDLRIGAWSEGGRRLTLVAGARTGRRLFLEVDGDVVRSNVFSVPDLP
jgi:hypothetical protein